MENINAIKYILTEVLPIEIPIIFSNEKFYNYLNENTLYLKSRKKLSDELGNITTIPVVFKIRKGKTDYRHISLIHPYMQLILTKFINKYSNIIVSYFKQNTLFSIRVPLEINTFFNSTTKYKSFFKLGKYPKITDFYKSYELKDLEMKYSYLLKLDIANCFNSIYTHSIDWAYLGGKEFAKSNISNKERFSYLIDQLMQTMNYKETNGILIGPEFSRLFAEIIFTRLDHLIYEDLEKKGIYYKNDYEIVRFIDDIFVFSSSKDILEVIEDIVKENCVKYKLAINEKKKYIETVPFMREHMWVYEVKEILNQFFTINDNLNNLSIRKIQYDNFIYGIKCIVVKYEGHVQHIVSYLITVLEKKQEKYFEKLDVENKEQEELVSKNKYFEGSRYIDLVTQILNLSITYENVNKTCYIFFRFIMFFEKNDEYSFKDLVFKKAYLLLKYHMDSWTELQNLVLLLSCIKNKNIPEKFFLSIIEKDQGYFSLSVITYYILQVNQDKKSYKQTYKKINDIFYYLLLECEEKYKFSYENNKYDPKSLKAFILSDKFYLIHDFYGSGFLSRGNCKKISKIIDYIKQYTSFCKVVEHPEKPFNIFLQYIKDFDKTFIDWESIYDENILKAQSNQEQERFGY